jgi:hypothetical protein
MQYLETPFPEFSVLDVKSAKNVVAIAGDSG